MLLQEFESLTGFYPTEDLYREIEERYSAAGVDKEEFCRLYKENTDGLAESIQAAVNGEALEKERQSRTENVRLTLKINAMHSRIERLNKQLERQQGWKPVELSEMRQKEYDEMMAEGGTRQLSQKEAVEWISREFGFAADKIYVFTEIPVYERSLDGHIRKRGMVSRPPAYNATDWNYVRFDVTGWQYEAVNGWLYHYKD